MKNLLKEFKNLLEESDELPLDELRNYYLAPAKEFLLSHPEITSLVIEDQTALIMTIKKIIKSTYPLRTTHLNLLLWEIVDLTPKEILNYQDKEGNSAAHYTCHIEGFSVGLLDLMKQAGVNFNLQNKKGETPLILISDSDSLDDLKFIHAYTSDKMINAKEFTTGGTALHKAVKSKKLNNVLFLLESGASVFEKDNNNNTVIDYLDKKELFKRSTPHYFIELKKILKAFSEKEKAEKVIETFTKKS